MDELKEKDEFEINRILDEWEPIPVYITDLPDSDLPKIINTIYGIDEFERYVNQPLYKLGLAHKQVTLRLAYIERATIYPICSEQRMALSMISDHFTQILSEAVAQYLYDNYDFGPMIKWPGKNVQHHIDWSIIDHKLDSWRLPDRFTSEIRTSLEIKSAERDLP